MGQNLRVGFLSHHNAFDKQAFSGTVYHAARALGARPGIDLQILGPHRPIRLWHRVTRKLLEAPQLDASKLDVTGLDAVVGMVATGHLRALLPQGVPLLHVTDSTAAFQRDFYNVGLSAEDENGEAFIVQQAARTVYSSHYMADLAVTEYDLGNADRLAVVPFGVNFDDLPQARPEKPPMTPIRLLYVGVSWERKGGDIAVAALEQLRAQGIPVELTLVGPTPDDLSAREGLHLAGFLDKTRTSDLTKLKQLFSDAHLFVLPTRADCTPMVVAEANAYGTPVLITETGGIATLMAGGANGRMMPYEATAQDWARVIREMTTVSTQFEELSKTSFAHARERLTWAAWAEDMEKVLVDVCQQALRVA